MNWRHTFPYLCCQACVSSKIKSSKWMYHGDNIASCHHIQTAQLNEVLAHFVKRSKKWHIFRQHYAVGSLKYYSFFPPLHTSFHSALSRYATYFFFFLIFGVSHYFSELLTGSLLIFFQAFEAHHSDTFLFLWEKCEKKHIWDEKEQALCDVIPASMRLHFKWLRAFHWVLLLKMHTVIGSI